MLKRLLLLALCGLLLIVPCACGEVTEEEETEESKASQTLMTGNLTYVEDVAVNHFINTLINRGSFDPQSLRRGNADDEYILELDSCEVTLIPGKHGLNVMMTSARGSLGQEKLISSFTWLLKVVDKSCTQAQIDKAVKFIRNQGSASESMRVCNEVQLVCFSPSVKVGGTVTPNRLDLVLFNYASGE